MKLVTLMLFLCATATMGQTSSTTNDDRRWELKYDASGKLLSSSNEALSWGDTIPETIGGLLYFVRLPKELVKTIFM